MTKKIIGLLFLISISTVMLSFFGCGGMPKTVYDQPIVPSGYWELVWAEPKMIMTDSLFILIRSDWVDSIYTQTETPMSKDRIASLEFEVSEQSCFVSVNLHRGTHQDILLPLIAKQMPKGWYKLTPSVELLNRYDGPLMLRSRACGEMKMVWLVK